MTLIYIPLCVIATPCIMILLLIVLLNSTLPFWPDYFVLSIYLRQLLGSLA